MKVLISASFSYIFQVIPPGMDFSNVIAQEDTAEVDGELVALTNGDGASPKALPPIWSEVSRWFS